MTNKQIPNATRDVSWHMTVLERERIRISNLPRKLVLLQRRVKCLREQNREFETVMTELIDVELELSYLNSLQS